MLDRLSRVEILVGKEALEKIAEKRVAIFGVGGVGGNLHYIKVKHAWLGY